MGTSTKTLILRQGFSIHGTIRNNNTAKICKEQYTAPWFLTFVEAKYASGFSFIINTVDSVSNLDSLLFEV